MPSCHLILIQFMVALPFLAEFQEFLEFFSDLKMLLASAAALPVARGGQQLSEHQRIRKIRPFATYSALSEFAFPSARNSNCVQIFF